MQPCGEAPPEELFRARDEFNRGNWFECHETLEELWVGEKGELRDFYQGLLQVAVALHHWREGNFKGALLLLEKGGALLGRVSPLCQGVEVATLVRAADRFREELLKLGPERMEEMDRSLIPRIRMVETPPV